jgi:hypothetical protein
MACDCLDFQLLLTLFCFVFLCSGGVPTNEVNSLEVEFLFLANFTLSVTADTYHQYYSELCNHAANTSNACQCHQGPKVPPLVLPTLTQGSLYFKNSTVEISRSSILRDPERDLFIYVRKPNSVIEPEANPQWNFFAIPMDEELDALGQHRSIAHEQTKQNPIIVSQAPAPSLHAIAPMDTHNGGLALSASQSTRSFPLAGGLMGSTHAASAALVTGSLTPVNAAGAIGNSTRARASMIGAIQSSLSKVHPGSPTDVIMTSPSQGQKK